MPIIDAHVHLYPPEVNRAPAAWAAVVGEPHWALLSTRVRKNGRRVQAFPSVDELLAGMDAAGIDRAVLQGWYWETHESCEQQNDFYAECIRRHPERLSAFATFHPRAGLEKILAEIRRRAEQGFSGLGELSPHSQGFGIDDPAWRAALNLAGELHLSVNLHVTEPLSRAYPGRVETPLGDFVQMAREHPATTFILAHWGARLPLDLRYGTETRGLSNLYYDAAASPLLYATGVVGEMIEAAGVDRILFGSDYPLDLYPRREPAAGLGVFVDEIRSCGVSPEQSLAVLGGNAQRLLRLR